MKLDYAPPRQIARPHEASVAALLAAGAVAIGLAIQIQDGEYSPRAMFLVTVALLLTGAALCWTRLAFLPDRWLRRVMLGGILIEFAALFYSWPGVDLPHRGRWQLAPFDAGLIVALVWIGWDWIATARSRFDRRLRFRDPAAPIAKPQAADAVSSPPQPAFPWFPLLVLTNLLVAVWMIHSSPDPHIDVWVFQQDASKALLSGHNPYTMTFPDIYHSTFPGHQQVYGEGLVVDDRVQFGFPYPPVSLLLATIGYAVAHDHRYAQALALAISGLLIGYSRPGYVAKLAAALLLFTPRFFFVLGRAWTEPFTIMLLAATIFLACRRSKLLPIAFGLLLATKQYMVLAVPISFFLLSPGWKWRDWFDLLWQALVVGCVVTLPLALLDFHAFWKSTVTIQELAPFRWDALSYLVWYGFRGHLVTEPFTAVFWSSLAAAVTLGLCLWRAPRTPAGFAASLAFILLAFFSFNKQAFCNYYFFVIGATCCAVGAFADPSGIETAADRSTSLH
jgi:hypothetical protein